MTEKRFKQLTGKGFTYAFIDTENIDMSYLCDNEIDCKNIVDLLNEQHETIQQLQSENQELRNDNDIKFWKLQCIQSSNNNQIMLFELSRVIQQGYEVSDKFKQYLNEISEHDKEIREKHKRLFE